MLAVFGGLADGERELIRTAEGWSRAKAREQRIDTKRSCPSTSYGAIVAESPRPFLVRWDRWWVTRGNAC